MPYEAPEDIIARLSMSFTRGYDLALDRVRKLLDRLGNPQLDIPPVIHVAGTNGKGSTIAFMRAMLEAAGKRVHTHTSPHLIRFNERFRLATAPGESATVDDDRFAQALLRVERINDGEHITVFELLTAVTLVLFASNPADVTLLEVGLGGELDATNVIDPPLASVITPIALDHQGFLGGTIEKIAAAKAGIIKKGSPAVVGPQSDDLVTDVLEFHAARAHTTMKQAGQDWMVWEENGRLVLQDDEGLMDLALPRLMGQHQIINAGTAITALKAAGFALADKEIEAGLANVKWAGRLQKLSDGAVVDRALEGSEIWLDGGHNPAAGSVVASALADLEERVERPLFMITCMLNTKEPVGYFKPFADLVRHCFTVPLANTENAIDPEALAAFAIEAGVSAQSSDSVEAALEQLSENWQYERPPRILIGGSLYLVGEVLERNGTPAD
ncbi:MAG: folylpolyglutamate synthase/dihydrofolate synthase family protein [Hyphomicrobiales bacterium]